MTNRWSVDIIRGKTAEHLGTVEAKSQQEAYAAAIEKFSVTAPADCRRRMALNPIKT
jgi:hypothetical protein